ncbi:ferric reductase-like transmembrane domain-containing protein [Arthrobacter sp. ISL-72]|uniref:ferric reductase-like transmembrane domain-containing protein n=1 Tax=Arthrobacter sp. ISL-72 TaxID=2819114 RepID=UPI00288B2A2A|nr:ferric reductase-like transmembrane domain-containing protein [Arthrobacter sp. ISL-72]
MYKPTAGWASVAAAVALWLADGGARGFSTLTGAFTALGIVAGLAGMDLVLLMLLLAARLPVIHQTVGHDRALEFHRKLGKPSLYLLLAHGILIAVGYGMAEGLDPLSEAVSLWVLVPDMWLAYISMALFIAVVVTSLVAVRRRFPYEFWYAVHLLTCAAVATSLPHQFSVGGLFAVGTWQRWYWLAVCIATGALKAGTKVAVAGPYGIFSSAARTRGRTEQELHLGSEILALAKSRGATLFHLTGACSARYDGGRAGDGDRGRRTAHVGPGGGRMGHRGTGRAPRRRNPRNAWLSR